MAAESLVIDTDVIIAHLRARDKTDTIYRKSLKSFKCYTTFITEYEIYIGAKSDKHFKDADEIFKVIEVISNPSSCGKIAAKRLHELQDKGIEIGIMDALIAGICIFHNIPLLTINRKHFKEFVGLKLAEI